MPSIFIDGWCNMQCLLQFSETNHLLNTLWLKGHLKSQVLNTHSVSKLQFGPLQGSNKQIRSSTAKDSGFSFNTAMMSSIFFPVTFNTYMSSKYWKMSFFSNASLTAWNSLITAVLNCHCYYHILLYCVATYLLVVCLWHLENCVDFTI